MPASARVRTAIPDRSSSTRSCARPRHSLVVAFFTRRGIFYGWVIVASGFVMQMITSIGTQAASTYVVPLQREFGWSNASIGLARSFQQLADGLLGPVSGSLIDRFGPRRMMIIGVVLYSLALTLFSRIDAIWGYYATSFGTSFANSFLGLISVNIAINHWFAAKRTTALGFAVMGLGAGGAIVLPAIVWAQAALGWRTAAQLSAIGVLAIGIPAALLVRGSAERFGLPRDGRVVLPRESRPRQVNVDFTFTEARRTRTFWLLAAGSGLTIFVQSAILIYQFAHIELTTNRETATVVLILLNVSNILGRGVGGFLGDRLAKHTLLSVDALGTAAAVAVLSLSTSAPLFMVYGVLFGLFWGIRTPLNSALQAEYFGLRGLGRIAGTLSMTALPLAICGPVVVGALADALQGFRLAFGIIAIVSAASAAMYFFASPPAAPLVHENVSPRA
jgi:MFS family permease